MNSDELPLSSTTPKKYILLHIVRKECSSWKRRGSYQFPPSGSKSSALHNYSNPSAVHRSEERAKDQQLLHSLSRGGGVHAPCVPPTPKSPGRKRVWREFEVSAHSPAVEDVEKEGPYLANSGLFSALLPALVRVPGALPCAPVATQLQHLQLPAAPPRSGSEPRPRPRPPTRGRARQTVSRAASGRACAPPAACSSSRLLALLCGAASAW